MEKTLRINPWIEIWREPQRTIKTIVDRNPRFCFKILAGIYGLPIMFHVLQSLSTATTLSFFLNFLLALIFAIPVGYIGINVVAILIHWVGKRDGKASMEELKAAVAWSNVPGLITIFTWLVWFVFYQNRVFTVSFLEEPTFMRNPNALMAWGLVYFIFFVQFAVALFSFYLLVNTVAEVQKFSKTKAFFNVVIAAVVLGAAGLIIAAIF